MPSLSVPFPPASLPLFSGVYLFASEQGKILYVGKAKVLRNRLRSYLNSDNPKTKNLLSASQTLSYIAVDNEIDALILEANLIKKHSPKFNVNFKDGKNYPFLKITLSEKYPKIYVARKISDKDENLYFGPYPTGVDLKFILRFIRRVFPFCTHHKPYPSCLYYHLGLCPGPEFNVNSRSYRKNIKKIVLFLSGDKTKVLRLLHRELNREIKAQRFEKAGLIQAQINKLKTFSSFRRQPLDYLNDSQTLLNLRNKEQQELKAILTQNGIKISALQTIEGYDIANISGQEAAASLVRFKNAEPDKSGYRHFKIKSFGPNDYLMLQEAVNRRLKHPDWALPDLFLIDGGFGQLNAVREVLQKNKIDIPVVALAKKQEHLCLPNGREISLPFSSNALHLLQRVRDESHRFARRYHHLLRTRFLKSDF